MTIAERIHNDGWLLGMEKGKEGEQRLLRLLLQEQMQILNRYNDILDFRQSKCRH